MKSKIQRFKLNNFPGQSDDYQLAILENNFFEIKRIYYIHNITNESQSGAHAHIEEKEIFIILEGSATINIDQGNGIEEIKLNKLDAIFIDNLVWHQFSKFNKESKILALSSTHYKADRSDYITDYSIFKSKIENKL